MTSIREARPDDAPAIAGLLADIGHPVVSFEVPRRLEAVAEAPGKVFVAEDASAVIGVVSVNRMALLHRETPVALLSALVVRADRRGRGVGRALVDAVHSQATAWGCATVELTSRDDRQGAHQFYARLGFTTQSRKFVRAVALLAIMALALVRPLSAQMDPNQIPQRPVLPVDGDSNSASDYFWLGMSKLVKEPERAAAAFYWASRIDPYWADPIYSRHVALLLAQPYRLLDLYMKENSRGLDEPRLLAIDSLFYVAILRNPWVNRRIERTLLATWLQTDFGGSRGVPRYYREENPEVGGWLSYTEGKYDDAVADYAAAIARYPNDHIVRFWRALPFVAQGKNDSAIAAVQGALNAFRSSAAESLAFRYVGHPFMEYSLGLLFEAVHQPDSARAAYERSLLDDLTFYPAHRRLGSMRWVAGDTAGALAEFAQAEELAPNDVITLYEYGMLSLAAGQAGPGVELLKRASVAEPYFVPPHFTLARLYDQGGFVEEAITEYRTFLRLAPRTMAAQVTTVRERLRALGAPASGQ